MTYYIYSILYENKCVYVGMTKDIKRRQQTHNYLYKKGKKKLLYDFLRENGFNEKIELIITKSFSTKTEAKRWECFIILGDHFGLKQLRQVPPKISDR